MTVYAPSGTSVPISPLAPAVAVAETMPRHFPVASYTLTSGRLVLVAIGIQAGKLCSNITFVSGSTAAVTPTNQWFGLFDSSRNQLALTADATTAAWAAFTAKTLALSVPFTTTYSGLHYLGLMVAAATPPSIDAVNTAGSELAGISPVMTGASTTGLTTPASCPAQVAAPTFTAGQHVYGFVS